MKKYRSIILAGIFALLTIVYISLIQSCAPTRQALVKISEENKKNFILADTLTKDLHKVWPQISGAYAASINLLPPDITKRVLLIDFLLFKDIADTTKQSRAEAGTHFLFLLSDSAKSMYKAYAPDVLNLLTILGWL